MNSKKGVWCEKGRGADVKRWLGSSSVVIESVVIREFRKAIVSCSPFIDEVAYQIVYT